MSNRGPSVQRCPTMSNVIRNPLSYKRFLLDMTLDMMSNRARPNMTLDTVGHDVGHARRPVSGVKCDQIVATHWYCTTGPKVTTL